MKYFIELGVRCKGVQLLELNEEESSELLEEDLDEVYGEWVSAKDYEYALEGQYLMKGVDRYSLVIKDEEGKVVYESDHFEDLVNRTMDDDGEVQVVDWEFRGVEDGIYLTRIQTIKGACCEGELELDEPFDKAKLYIVRDEYIDDELMGDDVFPLCTLYYQQGEGYDKFRDSIDLEYVDDLGEQYFDTYLMRVSDKNWWEDMKEE